MVELDDDDDDDDDEETAGDDVVLHAKFGRLHLEQVPQSRI